ncbi:MAG: hypothetical protein ACXABY_03385 [Candidatus Thorarchaeota archaeon]|jgi:hypothetical protein
MEEQQGVFRRKTKFEINDYVFKEITVDENRIVAKGKEWRVFELLISFIGAVWMEKWRRFRGTLAAAGAFLIALPILLFLFGFFPFIWTAGLSGLFTLMIFWLPGIILILIWALFKRESMMVFCHNESFKFEGDAGFIEALWKEITRVQRLRDL